MNSTPGSRNKFNMQKQHQSQIKTVKTTDQQVYFTSKEALPTKTPTNLKLRPKSTIGNLIPQNQISERHEDLISRTMSTTTTSIKH